jgi:hypothetical protein
MLSVGTKEEEVVCKQMTWKWLLRGARASAAMNKRDSDRAFAIQMRIHLVFVMLLESIVI